MEGGALFISRNNLVFSWLKGVFEDCGFKDVILSSLEKDALTLQLNKLKPKYIFMHSEFYSGVTPYMIGCLLVKFPELNVSVVNFGNFPDSLAARFIFHGAKSYLDVNYGNDEFKNGLTAVKSGQDYYSPGVSRQIGFFNEMSNFTREITDREWQVLFLVCNGFKDKQIVFNLAISRRTVDAHINNLYKIFDVCNRKDLIRKAVCMGWVKKEHLCFHGTDVKISQHPSGKRKKITPPHGGDRITMRLAAV
ncbi:response regulator transcription factor [Treponema sp. R80B11-R83G3]